MTYLVGAWSASGRPLATLVPVAARQAMRAVVPPGPVSEISGDRLWLVAGADRFARAGGRVAAWEGFAAGIPRPGESPDGHYSRVVADPAGGRLTLHRGLSGGERLYFAERDGMVLFAGALRYLLAHPGVARDLDPERVPEVLLTGLPTFGRGSLVAGVDEVRAGHAVTWNGGGPVDEWWGEDLLEAPEGTLEDLAGRFRQVLGEAVAAAAGPGRPVAVALSGGIDSSAVAALAVEAFGADGVVAFTHEFDDPDHPSETPFAVAVCRRLGIRRHVVYPVTLRDFLTAIPETVWRAESFLHWPKAFMLAAARRIRDAGFDRFLCGFGVGSHMSYLADVAALVEGVPGGGRALGLWRLARSSRGRWIRHLAALHPGLAPPGWRLLLPILAVLRERGLAGHPVGFYPDEVRPLVAAVAGFGDDERSLLDGPLGPALRRLAFERLYSCVDVTRWEKPLRELAVQRLSPAHFASTIPYAYLPPAPGPGFLDPDRRLRPGKLLLRTAMRGRLPESVLFRRKSWADAVISPRWLEAGLRWMRNALPADPEQDPLARFGDGFRAAADRWDERAPQAAVTGFRFWHRLFMEGPPAQEPPRWPDLA